MSSKRPSDHRPLRILSGTLRGRVLATPPIAGTHPMGAREKLALFNTLTSLLPHSSLSRLRILDAYAGSGALGIEALSRGLEDSPSALDSKALSRGLEQGAPISLSVSTLGAPAVQPLARGLAQVVFIEKSPQAAQIIRENLTTLGLSKLGKVYSETVEDFCTNQAKHQVKFDLILADPPYGAFCRSEIDQLASLLSPGGILVLSHPDAPPEIRPCTIPGRQGQLAKVQTQPLKLLKSRQYARAHLSYYRLAPAPHTA